MADLASAKTCVICGVDCADRPRVKDPRGRYYCQPCYREARRTQPTGRAQGAAAPTPQATAPPREHEPTVPNLEEFAPPPPRASMAIACPGCGQRLPDHVAVCMRCGYDSASGRQTRIRTRRQPATSARPWLWPVDLYFRPRTFFRFFADPSGSVTALFFLGMGVAAAIDRLDSRLMMAELTGRMFFLPDTWGAYWAAAVGGGLISALLFACVGGWWYGLKLRWSGADDPDAPTVRRVYVLCSLVWAIPVLLDAGLGSLAHATPRARARSDPGILDFVVLICLFWSLFTSYAGVRTVFDVRPLKSAFWFLILPGALYGLGVLVLVVALVATGGFPDPPRVDQPQTYRAPALAFDYPGNWTVHEQPLGPGQGTATEIETPEGASIVILIYESESAIEDQIAAAIRDLGVAHRLLRAEAMYRRWGAYEGLGQPVFAQDVSGAVYLSIFVTRLDDRRCMRVHECAPSRHRDLVAPGIELVRATLVAR